jgi:hypothetical protein
MTTFSEVRDKTHGKNKKWYKVMDNYDSSSTKTAREIARFSSCGDAYVYALDISKRPGFVSSVEVTHIITIE